MKQSENTVHIGHWAILKAGWKRSTVFQLLMDLFPPLLILNMKNIMEFAFAKEVLHGPIKSIYEMLIGSTLVFAIFGFTLAALRLWIRGAEYYSQKVDSGKTD